MVEKLTYFQRCIGLGLILRSHPRLRRLFYNLLANLVDASSQKRASIPALPCFFGRDLGPELIEGLHNASLRGGGAVGRLINRPTPVFAGIYTELEPEVEPHKNQNQQQTKGAQDTRRVLHTWIICSRIGKAQP